MNGTELIARILKSEGVEWMACFPSNPLIEAAAKEGIRPIAFRQERGGMMAADGFSRVSDRQRFGVFAMQAAAGAENSVGGIAQAYADNVPVLILPGGAPLSRAGIRPTFSAVENYRGIVKHVEAITQPTQVADAMRRAFHALRNGRPGPVVVEMTTDVCGQDVPEEATEYRSPKISRQAPASGDVRDAVKALLAAKKPMIWAGRGVLAAGATSALTELAELTEIPVYTTMPGKSAFDERHPLSLGTGGMTTTLAAHTWLDESDLLFAVGSSMTITNYGQSIPPGKTLIHNVDTPDEINKDFAIDYPLPGDARLTLEAVIDEVKAQIGEAGRKGQTGVAEAIAEAKKQWLDEWMPLLTSDDVPVNPYRVIWEIDQNMDKDNSIFTHDAGAPRDQSVPFYTATVPHSFIGWGKTTHLGFGLPLIMGAKLANPDKFCLNLMGDAAFGMSGLDVETAARAGIAITTVLFNNGGMATYPGAFPTALEKFGVSKMNGNYAALAESLGATGLTVKTPDEIAPALKQAQRLNAEGKTVLIDVHSGYENRRSRW